jgi:phosphoribosylaminoimidazole-succinocarboxamide synthase
MTFQKSPAALPDQAITSIDMSPFPRIGSGKVREIFDLGDALLLAASDRLSAFDVILPDGIPGKGILLTQMSLWWFAKTAGIIPNHLLPDQEAEFDRRGIRGATCGCAAWWCASFAPSRSSVSCADTWRAAAGAPTPSREPCAASRCPLASGRPTGCRCPSSRPTTKAPKGSHDEAIDDAQGAAAVGPELYEPGQGGQPGPLRVRPRLGP